MRFKQLNFIMDEIIQGLRRGVNDMLYGIRWLCKQLDNMARIKFGNPKIKNDDENINSSEGKEDDEGKEGNITSNSDSDNNQVENVESKSEVEEGDEVINSKTLCATEKQITAIVCGFLVLRFINPMLLAPESCNLLNPETKVSKVLHSPTLSL